MCVWRHTVGPNDKTLPFPVSNPFHLESRKQVLCVVELTDVFSRIDGYKALGKMDYEYLADAMPPNNMQQFPCIKAEHSLGNLIPLLLSWKSFSSPIQFGTIIICFNSDTLHLQMCSTPGGIPCQWITALQRRAGSIVPLPRGAQALWTRSYGGDSPQHLDEEPSISLITGSAMVNNATIINRWLLPFKQTDSGDTTSDLEWKSRKMFYTYRRFVHAKWKK